MKRIKPLFISVIVLVVLAVLFVALSKPLFNLDLRFVRERIRSSSTATLVQVRDILALNTVEVVYKVVFPYDYVPADMNWSLILRQYREGRDLSLLEETYLEVYRLCEEIGINLESKKREFVVLTTILKGGFDLSDPVFASPESAGNRSNRFIMIDSENAITITLPDTVITDIIIEDAETRTYLYPDIRIGPEDWKMLTSFVERQVAADAEEHGILQLAEENGKRFLRRLLLDTGYDSVIFRE